METQVTNPDQPTNIQEEDEDEFRSCCGEEPWDNPAEELDPAKGNCCICFEDKPLFPMQCSHSFCSCCITLYIKEKQLSSQVPIKCPNWGCKKYIHDTKGSPKDLEDYEIDEDDANLMKLAENKRWRRCGECGRMIELWEGCNHMTCWCGHEFCFACGKVYRNGRKTCECALWYNAEERCNVIVFENGGQQLGIIETMLFGGVNVGDVEEQRRVPALITDGYADLMRDIGYLPWLEKLVSVISDSYYEDYI